MFALVVGSSAALTLACLVPASAAAAAPAPATRIAALWPFSASSPWNIGVGAAARFEPSNAPRTASLLRSSASPWVNAGQYSHPIYQATNADPFATVRRPGYPSVTYRIPSRARPSAGGDADLDVVEPNGRWLHESWLMTGANPAWTTGYHVLTDLRGSGVGSGGVRAYGGSAIGGLIRKWELDSGSVRHAIALAITGAQLRAGPVWPATSQDSGAAASYAGKTPMGTYAAIPPTVNLANLGLSREGLVLARALRDYGAYVVDRAGAFTFYADPSLEGTAGLARLRTDVGKLRAQLRVVVNNGPASVNGGGTRRVPPAPPFSG